MTINVFFVSHRIISSLNNITSLSFAPFLETEGGHEWVKRLDSQQVPFFCSKVVYLPRTVVLESTE
jgi:hypothetical protein